MTPFEAQLKLESLRKLEREAYARYLDSPDDTVSRAMSAAEWTGAQRRLDDHHSMMADMAKNGSGDAP